MKVALALALGIAAGLTSCASIVSKSEWPVVVKSEPPGLEFRIRAESGEVVARGRTPTTLNLRSKESYFHGADYVIEAGETKVPLDSSLNGWYWGNLLFGGLIGFFIVDPATGAMWRLPKEIVLNSASLPEATAAP